MSLLAGLAAAATHVPDALPGSSGPADTGRQALDAIRGGPPAAAHAMPAPDASPAVSPTPPPQPERAPGTPVEDPRGAAPEPVAGPIGAASPAGAESPEVTPRDAVSVDAEAAHDVVVSHAPAPDGPDLGPEPPPSGSAAATPAPGAPPQSGIGDPEIIPESRSSDAHRHEAPAPHDPHAGPRHTGPEVIPAVSSGVAPLGEPIPPPGDDGPIVQILPPPPFVAAPPPAPHQLAQAPMPGPTLTIGTIEVVVVDSEPPRRSGTESSPSQIAALHHLRRF